MSDDEHVSNEELEAAREMEMDDGEEEEKQPQPKKSKAEEAEEADEEAEEEKGEKRDDSDDNSEKSDEAIEDNEEPEVDGDSREPSDGESINDSESETEQEKRIRKAAALQFLDLEADEGTEKKIIKHLKKKIEDEDEENAYEKDSIMDDEGVITYDTDYEEERKMKKKKGSKADDKKKKKRKRIITPPSSSSDEEEEAAAESSSEEEAEQIEEVSDDELQNMQTLAGTNKNKKVSAANPPRGKAAFHEHSDIAKAAAEKKKQKVSPDSLLDSPKLKPTATPKKQAAAAAAKDGSSSSSKKPTAKKPRKSAAPTYQLGEIFEMKEKGKMQAYRITFRGEDAPMTLATSGKYELIPDLFHPKYFCTAEKLGENDTGVWDELGAFELFSVSPGHGMPKRVNPKWATSGWNTFNSQSNDERYKYVIDALNHNNMLKGTNEEGKPTKRKMFTDQLLQQIKSEAVLNPDGEWAWMPKHMEQHDFITPRKTDGSVAVSVKAAAASPTKKKPPAQQKPKIDRHKETSSHDVKAMLSKPPSTKKETTAAAAASSAPNSTKIAPKKKENFSDWFGESSPEPAQVEEAQAKLYGDAKALPNTMLMLAQFIEMTFHRMATNGKKKAAVERIQRFFETVDETLKTLDNMDQGLSLKQKCDLIDKSILEDLPKEMSKGFYMIVIMLPFFNAEAAQMMRDHLAGLAEKM